MSKQSNKSASNFALNLNVPPQKLFGWCRKPQLWASSDRQLHHNIMPAHTSQVVQSLLVKHQITQVTQPPQPRFGTLRLLAFSKTKTTFQREEILDHQWDSGKYDGAADGDKENCVGSQGAYFEGDWGIIVLGTMFLVSCILFIKYLYFSWLATFWTDPIWLKNARN